MLGIKPPDSRWKEMKLIWDACRAADVEPPKAVHEFFGGEAPNELGVEVSQRQLEEVGAIRNYETKNDLGFDVYLDKLPQDVKILRFYNNW
jgi:hypothetical protein